MAGRRLGYGMTWLDREGGRHAARRVFGMLGAIAFSTAVFSSLLVVSGKSPVGTLRAIAEGAFGTRLGFMETLTRATPLLLCGLAVAVPAKAGLLNIGGEGQLHAGAVAATAVALGSRGMPAAVVIPAMIAASAVAGALWAAVPGILRARIGVNEVLVGLMLNYVAIYMVEYLVHGPWKDPSALGWPYTAAFPRAAILPTLGTSNVHLGLLLGVGAALVAGVLMRTTVWGFAVRVIEANPRVAQFGGLDVARYLLVLMMIGGAMGALAGLGEVSVIQGRLRSDMSPGYGYSGFVVSWLAGHRFAVIVPVAILVGGLYAGSDAIQLEANLPSSTGDIFMGLVFLAFLLDSSFIRRPHAGAEGRTANE